jgi:hypothetical protein
LEKIIFWERAWMARGWRQYLIWFGKTELRLQEQNMLQLVEEWLAAGEQNWAFILANSEFF